MCECCTPSGYQTIFSEKSAQSQAKRYRRKGLDRVSRRIAATLKERGVEGRTILEVGGGIGGIEIELLRAGATQATNVELAPTYEKTASELLLEAGFVDRVDRRLGDFVETAAGVEAADYVILNRVVCCYQDMPMLVSAAAEHARNTLVLSFPNNRWWTRLALSLVNIGFRVFRVQFKVFLHPPARILAEAARPGLLPRVNHRGLVWQVATLERAE